MKKYFKDKLGREINILVIDLDINAFHNNKKIGELQFDMYEKELGYADYIDYIPRLYYMEVDPFFRRAGIAAKMMELAVELHGINFIRPKLNSVGGKYMECYEYYTDDGRSLIQACIKNKILNDDPTEEYDD